MTVLLWDIIGDKIKKLPRYFTFFFFWPYHTACGILVPQPEIEPVPLVVEAMSLNNRTAREVSEIAEMLKWLAQV